MSETTPVKIDLDVDDFTGDELVAIEDATGKVIGELFPDGKPSARGIYAAYWVIRRREDPAFTYQEALKTKLTAFAGFSKPASNGQAT